MYIKNHEISGKTSRGVPVIVVPFGRSLLANAPALAKYTKGGLDNRHALNRMRMFVQYEVFQHKALHQNAALPGSVDGRPLVNDVVQTFPVFSEPVERTSSIGLEEKPNIVFLQCLFDFFPRKIIESVQSSGIPNVLDGLDEVVVHEECFIGHFLPTLQCPM